VQESMSRLPAHNKKQFPKDFETRAKISSGQSRAALTNLDLPLTQILAVHLREPAPEDYRDDPWRRSWWKMMALREALERAV
jgi:hypothetical protein